LKCLANRSKKNQIFCNACVSFEFKDRFVEIAFSNLMSSPIGLESDVLDPVSHAESGKQFLDFTVPNRKAILLHEFSHVYLNDNVDDEVEADLNGLLIYLGLGYPRIEAFEVFAKTFLNAPSDLNQMRYEKIKNFIDNFENYNTFMYE
jgi:hypothetical protein